MYNAQIIFYPNQEIPPEKWIKDNLFKRVIEESDLMDKLLDDNKIVVELEFYNSDNKYSMDMNLTYTKEREVEYIKEQPTPYYRPEPKKWKIFTKIESLLTECFKVRK